MTDDPVDLDKHRRSVAKRATKDLCQQLQEFQGDQAGLRQRQDELEMLLIAAPAQTWPEAASKVRYLLQLFADTTEAQSPRRKQLIAQALVDIERLCDEAKTRS